MSQADVHYFGIRHHGPGSSKRLVAELEALQPSVVLIEGPSDCSELLPLLAHHQMKPPVALLAYAAENSAVSLYYPFAEYSPEYQACVWAIQNNADVAFIDLPVSVQLAQMLQSAESQSSEEDAHESESMTDALDSESAIESESQNAQVSSFSDRTEAVSSTQHDIRHDPIGALAQLAGYEDGEGWWNDLIEQNRDDNAQIFETVNSAMAALRDHLADRDELSEQDLVREAHMRIEINKCAKAAIGNVAVVCGAWHAPALKAQHTLKSDREQLKQLPKKLTKQKIKSTWIPWTTPRLATRSGYGAGVLAPMWYQHLWSEQNNHQFLELWFANISVLLREQGHVVSTASVIEAVRLSQSLAIIRNRPAPGFEEVREAAIACLCFGEVLQWQQIESALLLGHGVGVIPDDAPMMPLLEDLQQQQKRLKLKPEALEKELSIDLRSEAGLAKSILLHRLNVLGVPWGKIADTGSSRGTFRERWVIRWQPEYSVQLVENLVYGTTIEQAANDKLSEALSVEKRLKILAETVQMSLEAHLNKAADTGLKQLSDRAAQTSDALELIESLAPLVNVQRYGTARSMSLGHIHDLVRRLAIQSSLAIPYACRNLNDEEAWHYREAIAKAHQALILAELDDSVMDEWWRALKQTLDNPQSALLVSGLIARILYRAEKISEAQLTMLLQRSFSPAVAVGDSARFFEGFFTDAIDQLLFDPVLRKAVEAWLINIEESAFIEFLPLFRRVFSALDAHERKRMIDAVMSGRSNVTTQVQLNKEMLEHWPRQLSRIGLLLQRDKTWTQ